VLIAGVVLYPALELVRASLSRYSMTGVYQGAVGALNYRRLVEQEALGGVLVNTLIWVTVVVGLTLVISLGLAQLLDAPFAGRRLVRWAVIVPWAASLIVTSKLFVWLYDYYFGILNHALTTLGLIRGPVDWLGNDATVMAAMIAVGVFVSLPFTTYVLLAGLAAIPGDVYEAARLDGASALQEFRYVTVPGMQAIFLVTVMLSMVFTSTSLVVVNILTNGAPAERTNILPNFSYNLAMGTGRLGIASAVNMIFFPLLILVIVGISRRLLAARAA
jgi:multiple sugar transport system permease protein